MRLGEFFCCCHLVNIPTISFQDWSLTLTSGGTLCIAPKHKLMNDLASIAESLDVTFIVLTPTGE
jgi:hypothetical protein